MPTNKDRITAKDILVSYLEYLTIDVSNMDKKPWLAGMLTRYAVEEMTSRRIGLSSSQIWEATHSWFSQQ